MPSIDGIRTQRQARVLVPDNTAETELSPLSAPGRYLSISTVTPSVSCQSTRHVRMDPAATSKFTRRDNPVESRGTKCGSPRTTQRNRQISLPGTPSNSCTRPPTGDPRYISGSPGSALTLDRCLASMASEPRDRRGCWYRTIPQRRSCPRSLHPDAVPQSRPSRRRFLANLRVMYAWTPQQPQNSRGMAIQWTVAVQSAAHCGLPRETG
jgi:hypothetical protein